MPSDPEGIGYRSAGASGIVGMPHLEFTVNGPPVSHQTKDKANLSPGRGLSGQKPPWFGQERRP